MPYLTTSKTRAPRYDVIVIGSGAAGGMAVQVLAQAGVKVLMLEAGRKYDPASETPMFETNADAYRSAARIRRINRAAFAGRHHRWLGGGW